MSRIKRVIVIVPAAFLCIGVFSVLLSFDYASRLLSVAFCLICIFFIICLTQKRIRLIICLIYLLAVSSLTIVFSVTLYRSYYANNREIIDMCNSAYPGVFSVKENEEDHLKFYVEKYYINEGLRIKDVSFSPKDCLTIANSVINVNNGFSLSFEYPNGALITFSNYDNERFCDVCFDNSKTRGYIVPNLGYYDNYTGFDTYYIYGAMNDLPTFEESKAKRNIQGHYLKMLEYILNNAVLITDKHTYNEEYFSSCYLSDDHSFGHLLESLSNTNSQIVFVEDDTREYGDRYSRSFLSPDWFSLTDIAVNMNIYMEKKVDDQTSNYLSHYLFVGSDKPNDTIVYLNEHRLYMILLCLGVFEAILIFSGLIILVEDKKHPNNLAKIRPQ